MTWKRVCKDRWFAFATTIKVISHVRHGVWNRCHIDCVFTSLYRFPLKKASKLRITCPFDTAHSAKGESTRHSDSIARSFSMPWRHFDNKQRVYLKINNPSFLQWYTDLVISLILYHGSWCRRRCVHIIPMDEVLLNYLNRICVIELMTCVDHIFPRFLRPALFIGAYKYHTISTTTYLSIKDLSYIK